MPPPDTAFTAGQEVYTDADNQVWLRSGAQLTSAGSGALEAAQYRDSQASVAVTSPLVSTGNANARPDRHSISYNGNHLVVVGFYQLTSTFAIELFDATTGASVDEVTNAGSIGYGAYAAYTDTHTFMSGSTDGTTQANWSSNALVYVPTSQLETASDIIFAGAGGGGGVTPTTYLAPHNAAPFTVTNPGAANERFWQLNQSGGTIINEYTFDDTAPAGTNPFTATGNSITLDTPYVGGAANPISLAADENLLYVHSVTNVLEYNATTRELVRIIEGVPTGQGLANSTTLRGQAFALVPNARTSDSSRALWFSSNPSVATTNAQVNVNKWTEIEILTSVYDGNSSYDPTTGGGTRDAIVLGDAGDTAAHIGQSTTDLIYMWQRIA